MEVLVKGFQWLVAEYRRFFLSLVLLFVCTPFVLIIALFSFALGILDSPMLRALQISNDQHQVYNKSLINAVEWLEINNSEIIQSRRASERIITRLDIMCQNDADKTTTKEDDQRCENLIWTYGQHD